MKTYFVGITGGIGSGKTLLSDTLLNNGAYIIDADVVSREVLNKGGEAAIREEFGDRFFSFNGLDRAALRKFVFPDKVDRLNKALSPLIRAEIELKMAEAAKINTEIQGDGYKVVFVVVPLLFEFDYQVLFNEVWTVTANKQSRINRVKLRDNINGNDVQRIMKTQMSDLRRRRGCAVIFVNDGTIEEFKAEALRVYAELESRLLSLDDGF